MLLCSLCIRWIRIELNCTKAASWLLYVVSICYLCFKCKRVVCILLCSWLLVNVNTYHNCSHLHDLFCLFLSYFSLCLSISLSRVFIFVSNCHTWDTHSHELLCVYFSFSRFYFCKTLLVFFSVNCNAINNNQITVYLYRG